MSQKTETGIVSLSVVNVSDSFSKQHEYFLLTCIPKGQQKDSSLWSDLIRVDCVFMRN